MSRPRRARPGVAPKVRISAGRVAYRVVETSAGFVAFSAGVKGLRRVTMPKVDPRSAEREICAADAGASRDPRLMQSFAEALVAYFAGRPVRFAEFPLDCADASAFERAVWEACRRIGYGETTSYAGLAARVGRPRAARAVGNAMRRNRFPIIVPCHRVVCSDGSLGGYGGSAGLRLKQDLIEMEAGAAR